MKMYFALPLFKKNKKNYSQLILNIAVIFLYSWLAYFRVYFYEADMEEFTEKNWNVDFFCISLSLKRACVLFASLKQLLY